ncbi:aminotransferase class I/II-fold pyridoxal phosphate-dependent enzyme [Amycolatopsis anabasis]|uniref:aminotransferase class I/II-fold pyridoxal phosphate-dependent enzyme n=1 Tax=Amycolatopsis anabasis TaxID=1840409 RepID=UPI00131E938F|nr:aminotransferase class I/II-fold pyridoxal phosphate-dependent enzyme [Amycolatopsis anabasis]
MRMNVFRQEEFFENYEFHCEYMLALSGVEPLTYRELTELAGPGPEPGHEVGYTPSAGYRELREVIAAQYPSARAENVLVTVGAIEALLILVNLLVEPGDEAVCLWPGYQPLHEYVTAAGGRLRLVPLAAADGFRIDSGRILDAVTERTRLVLINSPHNPTGQRVPAGELAELAATLGDRGVHLLVDEVFREMREDAEPTAWQPNPALSVVGGLSKAYGLPGLRIGWLVADEDLVVRARQYRKYTSLNPGSLDQAWAVAVLRARDRVLARTHELVRRGLRTTLDWFERWQDRFELVPPAGGGLVFPRLLGGTPTREFCVELVERTGVLLAPGSDCYDTEGHLRMGFATSQLEAGLARIDGFLDR